MKKALIIAMAFVHLTGNTELGQILRLPELISHYFQHHRQNQDISFFEFIAMHYGGDDGTSADDDFDSQLPCHNLTHNTISLVFSPMTADNLPPAAKPVYKTAYSDFINNNTAPKHTFMVLQPPRA